MLQLVALTCMEPPASFEADKVRDEKVKVLAAITPPDLSDTVRAQYTAGVEGGEEVKGYLEEDDVPDDSQTETYAALRLEVHNWRWAGVPIPMSSAPVIWMWSMKFRFQIGSNIMFANRNAITFWTVS